MTDYKEVKKVVDNPDLVYRIYPKEKAENILKTFRGILELDKLLKKWENSP